MATKKIQIIPPGYTDVCYPQTTASVVIEETDKNFVRDYDKAIMTGIYPASLLNEETLSGNKTLLITDKPIQHLNLNKINRTVTLPVTGATQGLTFRIKNVGFYTPNSGVFTDTAVVIVKKEGSPTILASIAGQEWIEFVFDGSNWVVSKRHNFRAQVVEFPNIIGEDSAKVSNPAQDTVYFGLADSSVMDQAFPRFGGESETSAIIEADTTGDNADINLKSKGTGKIRANGKLIRTELDDSLAVSATTDKVFTFGTDELIQYITSNSHTRVITLSHTNAVRGACFIIKNTGSTYLFTLKSNSTTIRNKVYPGETLVCRFNGTLWEIEQEKAFSDIYVSNLSVETSFKDANGYDKFSKYTGTITTTWTGSSAPYTQAVTVSGILGTDNPHITPVYSTYNATAILEKEAWSKIGKAVTSGNTITFTCFEEKPTQQISIQVEVHR